MAQKYTAEHIEYLRTIAPGRYISQIVQLMNEKFGLDLSYAQIKALMSNRSIRNGMKLRCRPEKVHRLTTLEQDEWIKANALGKSGAELINMIKNKFGIIFTPEQIKSYKSRKHINTGLTGHFKKGSVPKNKGKKLSPELYEKAAPTMFKKGHRPSNYCPVGTVLVKGDGYTYVKIADPGVWKQKHVLVWEAVNGPRPKGHKLIFADGNKQNFRLENIILVSNAEHVRLNQNHLISDNADITKAGVLLAKLITKSAKLKRGDNLDK